MSTSTSAPSGPARCGDGRHKESPGPPRSSSRWRLPQPLGSSQEQPSFRSGVDIAELDVSVLDARGRPVTDLAPSDFTVLIDGRPRRVVDARLLAAGQASRGPHRTRPAGLDVLYTSNATGGSDTRGRRIVLVVDRGSLTFGEGRHALRGAAEFVGRLHPLDRVALYPVWNTAARINFTSDHRRVREEIARMGGQGDPWSLLGTVDLDAAHVGISEAYAIVVGGSERLLDNARRGHR